MGVDQTSLDRIRKVTFPTTRRGYDKTEVEKFLGRLADWLESGAGDETRSDTVKRELERVGQRTGAILAQAEESAQQIRAEAEEEAKGTINAANQQAQETRSEADSYSSETRAAAENYSRQTREQAEQDTATTRAEAAQDARETTDGAHAQARRIVEEGTQRREDVEAVIADLVRRRDDVIGDTEELGGKLRAAAAAHRPPEGADPFDKPDELDPLAREGDELKLEDEAGTDAGLDETESDHEADLRT